MALTAPVSIYTAAMVPVGGVAWDPIFSTLATWLIANATVPPLGLVAPPSGGPLTGAATITAPSDDATMLVLGTQLASAVMGKPISDSGVIAAAPYWAGFAKAVVTTITVPMQVMPGTMQATNTPVSPGVVSGQGTFVPVGGPAVLTSLIVANLPVTDAPGQAAWLLPATQILLWLTAAMTITFDVPPIVSAGGGPPVGIFKLS